jgi:apolipoprotein N-acyltransferase
VYGVSFEIALVNTVFAAVALVHRKRRIPMLAVALAGAIALQATVLVKAEPSAVDAHATLVQQNVPIVRQWSYEQYKALVDALSAMSVAPQAAKEPGVAPLIVWPESPAPFESDDRLFTESTAELARQQRSWLLAGVTAVQPGTRTDEGGQVYNSAVLLAPSGTVVQRYDKVHLVPWGEYVPFAWAFGFAKSLTHEVGTFAPGEAGRTPLEVGSHRYGVFICYESVFPHEVRQFAGHGAEVFVNISNDAWFGDSGAPWQHLNMARMRAVENHRWLLRCTNNGVTASIDPLGRVATVARRNERVALAAPYGLLSDTTFYTRYGDWFPILCAIISITGLLWRSHGGAHITHPVPV